MSEGRRMYAVMRGDDCTLRVCLAHGHAEECAYLTRGPGDFQTSEEWFIYRDSTIRDAKQDPTNPYRIEEIKAFTESELAARDREMFEAGREYHHIDTGKCDRGPVTVEWAHTTFDDYERQRGK